MLMFTACDMPTMMIVYPSAGDLSASSAARLPPAPGRLSITTCWLHVSVIFCPMMRANASVAPPGGNGTRKRIALSG